VLGNFTVLGRPSLGSSRKRDKGARFGPSSPHHETTLNFTNLWLRVQRDAAQERFPGPWASPGTSGPCPPLDRIPVDPGCVPAARGAPALRLFPSLVALTPLRLLPSLVALTLLGAFPAPPDAPAPRAVPGPRDVRAPQGLPPPGRSRSTRCGSESPAPASIARLRTVSAVGPPTAFTRAPRGATRARLLALPPPRERRPRPPRRRLPALPALAPTLLFGANHFLKVEERVARPPPVPPLSCYSRGTPQGPAFTTTSTAKSSVWSARSRWRCGTAVRLELSLHVLLEHALVIREIRVAEYLGAPRAEEAAR